MPAATEESAGRVPEEAAERHALSGWGLPGRALPVYPRHARVWRRVRPVQRQWRLLRRGTGCDFGEGPACLDLSTKQTACGTVCADVENGLNFAPDRVWADGVCVLP